MVTRDAFYFTIFCIRLSVIFSAAFYFNVAEMITIFELKRCKYLSIHLLRLSYCLYTISDGLHLHSFVPISSLFDSRFIFHNVVVVLKVLKSPDCQDTIIKNYYFLMIKGVMKIRNNVN